MANLAQLKSLSQNKTLLNRVEAAVAVVADKIRLENLSATNPRAVWGRDALMSPRPKALEMIWGLLIQNRGLTPAQITGASDSATINAVSATVNFYAGA